MAEIGSRIGSLQPTTEGVPPFRWLPVQVTSRALGSPLGLYHGIRKALQDATGTDPEPEAQTRSRPVGFEMGIQQFGHATRQYRIEETDRVPPEDKSADLTALLRDLNWPAETGVCLLIDEAQKLDDPERTGEIGSVLDALHQGRHGQPVFLASFGLSDTAEVMGRIGISAGRFTDGNVCNIGPLTEPEVLEFLSKAFRDWELPSGQPPWTWTDRIAETVCGWPQHLKTVTSAVLAETLKAAEVGRTPVWPEERIEQAKRNYYVGRLRAAGLEYGPLYAGIAESAREGIAGTRDPVPLRRPCPGTAGGRLRLPIRRIRRVPPEDRPRRSAVPDSGNRTLRGSDSVVLELAQTGVRPGEQPGRRPDGRPVRPSRRVRSRRKSQLRMTRKQELPAPIPQRISPPGSGVLPGLSTGRRP